MIRNVRRVILPHELFAGIFNSNSKLFETLFMNGNENERFWAWAEHASALGIAPCPAYTQYANFGSPKYTRAGMSHS